MQDELKKQKVTLTLEHPKVEGGVQTYRTADGWEMILILGRQEGEHYQVHRMAVSGAGLVAELTKTLVKDFPEIVMPTIMHTVMGDLKEHIGKTKETSTGMDANPDEPPPGTKFN